MALKILIERTYMLICVSHCVTPFFTNALQINKQTALQKLHLSNWNFSDFFRLLQDCATQFGEMFVIWVGLRPFVFIQSAEACQVCLNFSHSLRH